MRCLIDIGVQKTGSKARQRFFLRELGKLTSGAGLYPESGREGVWHQPLFFALQQGSDDLLMDIRREAVASGCEYVVISYEGMHALAETEIRRIKAVFPDLEIFVFVRRQDEFMNSLRNQQYKAHRRSIRDIEDFEKRMFERDSRGDYGAIVQRWSACVGAARVKPVVYRRSNCSVEAFVRAAGLAMEIPANTSHVHNRAIDGFGMAVLRHVKAMARNDDELPALVEQAHKDLAAHFISADQGLLHWTLTEPQRFHIMSLYEESNEWLREHYFGQVESLFPESEKGLLEIFDPEQCSDFASAVVTSARQKPCSK